MCIISNNNVKVSDGNVIVYKVLVQKGKYLFTPYRNANGTKDDAAHKEGFVPDKNSPSHITNVIKNSAIDSFIDGYGISCFLDIQAAREYAKILLTKELAPVKITKFRIPYGGIYQEGTIAKGFKGSGLPAVRTTQLEAIVG